MDIRGEYWSTEKEHEEGLAMCKKENETKNCAVE